MLKGFSRVSTKMRFQTFELFHNWSNFATSSDRERFDKEFFGWKEEFSAFEDKLWSKTSAV